MAINVCDNTHLKLRLRLTGVSSDEAIWNLFKNVVISFVIRNSTLRIAALEKKG